MDVASQFSTAQSSGSNRFSCLFHLFPYRSLGSGDLCGLGPKLNLLNLAWRVQQSILSLKVASQAKYKVQTLR